MVNSQCLEYLGFINLDKIVTLQYNAWGHEVLYSSLLRYSTKWSTLWTDRTLRYYLSKLISLWGASKSSYVVYNFTHTIQGDFFCVCQTYGARKGCHLLWVGKHNKWFDRKLNWQHKLFNVSSVVEFLRYWVLKSKIFGQISTF